MNAIRPVATLVVMVSAVVVAAVQPEPRAFDPETDLLSLHFDHAPDTDDGHSAAADRTVLQSLFGLAWMRSHVVVVSGAHGKNRLLFRRGSNAVMDAVWNECGGWKSAHTSRQETVDFLAVRWTKAIAEGGVVWVKEGGQSDLTAAVLERMHDQSPAIDTRKHVVVIQHSDWNESQSRTEALEAVKANTAYVKIADANVTLARETANESFINAARSHPAFGAAWDAAFAYCDPMLRIDFSDTGELLHILGLGNMDIDAFQERFLTQPKPDNDMETNR